MIEKLTIRNVPESTHKALKELSAKMSMGLGEVLEHIAESYTANAFPSDDKAKTKAFFNEVHKLEKTALRLCKTMEETYDILAMSVIASKPTEKIDLLTRFINKRK